MKNSFFNLLNFHNEATNLLNIEIIRGSKEITTNYKGKKHFTKANEFVENNLFFIKNNSSHVIGKTNDNSWLLKVIKSRYKPKDEEMNYIKNQLEKKGFLFEQKIGFYLFFMQYELTLGKYMQQLIAIILFVDNSYEEITQISNLEYINILKSQLSPLETKFIWIYCHVFNPERLDLLKKYDIIKNQVKLFEAKESGT